MSRLRLLFLGALALLTVTTGALPALAHGGASTLAFEATPKPDGVVDVRARITYDDDGHGVEDATVIVQPVQPDGAPLGTVPLEDQGDGYYSAQLSLPSGGDWTLVVSSDDPEVRAESMVEVDKPTADTQPDGDPIVVAPNPAADDVDSNNENDNDEVPVPGADDDATGSIPWGIIGIVFVVLVLIAVVPIAMARRRAGGSS